MTVKWSKFVDMMGTLALLNRMNKMIESMENTCERECGVEQKQKL